MLDRFTNHIGTLSVLTTVASSFFTMTFIIAYLSPFDWTLIWLIEYPDILKFCLIGLAIFSCILFFGMNYFETIYNWITSSGKRWIAYFVGLLLIIGGWLTITLYTDIYYSTAPAKEFHVLSCMTLLFVIFMAYSVIHSYIEYLKLPKPVTFNILPSLNFFALVVVTFLMLGRTAGLAVRDVNSQTHTITFNAESGLKESPLAKIVMVTSQYTIFEAPEGLSAVPSDIVIKIKRNPSTECAVCKLTPIK